MQKTNLYKNEQLQLHLLTFKSSLGLLLRILSGIKSTTRRNKQGKRSKFSTYQSETYG